MRGGRNNPLELDLRPSSKGQCGRKDPFKAPLGGRKIPYVIIAEKQERKYIDHMTFEPLCDVIKELCSRLKNTRTEPYSAQKKILSLDGRSRWKQGWLIWNRIARNRMWMLDSGSKRRQSKPSRSKNSHLEKPFLN